MSTPKPGQPGRWRDYVIIDGLMTHKRWYNPDGTRKQGEALEREKAKVELERLAERIMACP